jgi:hypothetical protein
MAHFARINAQAIVEEVIVAEQDYIDTLPNAQFWIQTSYNTKGGVHYGPDGEPDGGVALRGNYAGVGFHYSIQKDFFYPPQPFPSWVLSPKTLSWEAPVLYPADGKHYIWNETQQNWVED